MWEFDSLIPNQENRSLNWLRYFRGIAQLVARLVRDEEAVGSNPAAPTNKNQYTFVYWFFFVSARDLNRAAVRSTANSPLADYPGYLLDYENPYGAGRISIL